MITTKRREPWIDDDLAPRLHALLGGIVRSDRSVACEIGGIEDHVRLLIRWRPDESISNLLREVESRSSFWVHRTLPELAPFAWQEGYSVFSVSESQEQSVRGYMVNPAQHHQRQDFKSELLRLLKAHQTEFEKRCVFD